MSKTQTFTFDFEFCGVLFNCEATFNNDGLTKSQTPDHAEPENGEWVLEEISVTTPTTGNDVTAELMEAFIQPAYGEMKSVWQKIVDKANENFEEE